MTSTMRLAVLTLGAALVVACTANPIPHPHTDAGTAGQRTPDQDSADPADPTLNPRTDTSESQTDTLAGHDTVMGDTSPVPEDAPGDLGPELDAFADAEVPVDAPMETDEADETVDAGDAPDGDAVPVWDVPKD